MATGAGKTTVMAMIIAWQTLNAVRMPGSDRFSRAFLIVTSGITIKDRLQVLYPEHPESYYRARELLPNYMLGDIGKAAVVITNYHAFQHRETMALSRVGRAFLTGNDPEPGETRETDGQVLDRACGKLLSLIRGDVFYLIVKYGVPKGIRTHYRRERDATVSTIVHHIPETYIITKDLYVAHPLLSEPIRCRILDKFWI